jgi:malonyl-CoA O-methyltransferase
MLPRINTPVSRKLLKQRLRGVAAKQDFVACLSAEKLLQCIEIPGASPDHENSRVMALYERETGLSRGMVEQGLMIDQVPFDMIEAGPEQLMSMLAASQYSHIVCNLAFDWVDAGVFIRLLDHLLKPDGEFWFSCYGPLTANSTRSILSDIDQYAHFNEYYDVRDVGDALLGAGFKAVVLESSMTNLEYDSADALLADAVRVFGVNTLPDRRKGLMSGGVLHEFKKRVETKIQSNGRFTEQVEMLIAHGKKPDVPALSGVIPVRQG